MSEIVQYSPLRSNKERIPLGDSVPLMGPLSVYLETTNICNFKCVFCPESFASYSEISGGFFRLSSDDFSRVADQLAEVGTVKTLNFYMMGEPFANRDLLSFVSEAKRKKVAERIIVTSNGSLIKPKLYDDLCKTQLDTFASPSTAQMKRSSGRARPVR